MIRGVFLYKLFWRVVKLYIEKGFEDVMVELREKSLKVYIEMCVWDVKRFCRCFYKCWVCIDVIFNMVEIFNLWIIEVREKLILIMLE